VAPLASFTVTVALSIGAPTATVPARLVDVTTVVAVPVLSVLPPPPPPHAARTAANTGEATPMKEILSRDETKSRMLHLSM
jgi:hypothetical protein